MNWRMYWCIVQYNCCQPLMLHWPSHLSSWFVSTYLGVCGPHWTDFELVGQGWCAANSCSVAPGLRPVMHIWKPTTDNGSYRQSLSNRTISWLFVVPTSSRWRRCFMAGQAKQTIEEEWIGGGRKGSWPGSAAALRCSHWPVWALKWGRAS